MNHGYRLNMHGCATDVIDKYTTTGVIRIYEIISLSMQKTSLFHQAKLTWKEGCLYYIN